MRLRADEDVSAPRRRRSAPASTFGPCAASPSRSCRATSRSCCAAVVGWPGAALLHRPRCIRGA